MPRSKYLTLLGLAPLIATLFAQVPALGDVSITPQTWYSAGSAGTPVANNGLQFSTNEGTGVQQVLTYFDPISLTNVGDHLSLSMKFTPEFTGGASVGYVFGFGFYNSNEKQISENGLGATGGGGSAGNPFTGYRGYRVGVSPRSNNAAPFELRARSGNNSTLANTGSAHATNLGTGGAASGSTFVSGTSYDVAYTISRTGVESLEVSFLITGGSLTGYSETWNIGLSSPLYTSFDTFAISLGNGSVFSSLTLYDVSINSNIPESGTVASLMALGALFVIVGIRYWKR